MADRETQVVTAFEANTAPETEPKRMTLPGPRATIQSATEADLPSIAMLAGSIWRACYAEILTPAQIDYMLARMYALDRLREELRDGVRFDLLIVEKLTCGFASYGPPECTGTIKLHKLYLDPAWHRRGLGTLLLRHCEREAARMHAHRMVLNVNKRNTPAIAVYQRNGFAVVNPVVSDIGGGFVMDDFVMAKELAAPGSRGTVPLSGTGPA